MNSHISNTYTLQADDIETGQVGAIADRHAVWDQVIFQR